MDTLATEVGLSLPPKVHRAVLVGNKLVDLSTYLYLDGNRYWYSTQASVARLAQERAAAQAEHDVLDLVRRRLQDQAKDRGEFARVHVAPPNPNDVPDDPEARLVILGPEQPICRSSRTVLRCG